MREVLRMCVAVGILAAWVCAGCDRTPPETADLPGGLTASDRPASDGEKMDQKMLTFNFSEFTQEGKKKMEIEGESADIFSSSVELSNLTTHVYGSSQNITVTSDAGTFDRTNNQVQLVHNVVARAEDGSTVRTESLNYDSDNGVGTTEDFTRITRDNMISTGMGAVVRSQEQKARLNRDVQVEFTDKTKPGQPPTLITCDGPLDVDYERQLAVFNENVLVRDERGTVHSDRMDVYFDRQDKAISKIICIGNVHIQQEGNQSFSDRAVYLAQKGRVILTGSPKLLLYPDDLKQSNALIENTGTGQDL